MLSQFKQKDQDDSIPSSDQQVFLLSKKITFGDIQDTSCAMQNADIVVMLAADKAMKPAGSTGKESYIHLPAATSLVVEKQLALLLMQLYVQGASLDWEQLHPDGSGQIVHLPAHPFEPHAHWVDVNQGTEVLI
jgi:hypothetical protein